MIAPVSPHDRRTIDVVTFGESSLDFVAVLAADPPFAGKQRLVSFDQRPGGQAATAAVAAARQGLRARFVGNFGVDPWGDEVELGLRRERVEVVRIDRPGARSRAAVVIVPPSGERSVLEYRDGRLAGSVEFAIPAVAGGAVLLVDATDLAASRRFAQAGRASGVRTVVDVDRAAPEIESLLRLIDVIIAPEPLVVELAGAADIGAALRRMAAAFPGAVVVATLGELGSLAYAGGREVRTRGFKVDVVDTTGAGDAFRGGFASAWCRAGEAPDLEEMLLAANATAALNCRAVGAQTALPTLPEVLALVTDGTAQRSN